MSLSMQAVRHALVKSKSLAGSTTKKTGDVISARMFSTSVVNDYRPFATALSDIMSPSQFEQKESEIAASMSAESEYRPFATALSDTMSPSPFEQNQGEIAHNKDQEYWSEHRPFATALSDTMSPSLYEQTEVVVDKQIEIDAHYHSFATALSDAMSPSDFEQKESEHKMKSEWSQSVSFASPESDFSACTDIEYLAMAISKDDEFQSSMAYSLSLASPESDFTSLPLTDLMQSQLLNVEAANDHFRTNPLHLQGASEAVHDTSLRTNQSLPKTFQEALHESQREAIVVTEMMPPFRIVSVNGPWEKLCGFSQKESVGKTLEILQGPQTDKATITALLNQMLKGEEAGAELINYDKNGKTFHNRLTVGPLRNEQNHITHFVGLLKDVNAQNNINVMSA